LPETKAADYGLEHAVDVCPRNGPHATNLPYSRLLPTIYLKRGIPQLRRQKETPMQYKTMVLELLSESAKLYEQLRQTRRLLPTLETCAQQLKASHEAWMKTLAEAKPDSQQSQIASEALELALKELVDRLPSVLPQEDGEPLSLDQAIAFVRNHTSNG